MKPPKDIRSRGEYPVFDGSGFEAFMRDVRSERVMVQITSRATGQVRFVTMDEFIADSMALLLHSRCRLIRMEETQ